MKKIFLWLLKYYSKTEKDRIEIIENLNNSVQEDYCEQTLPGNVYNLFIEFMLGNDYVKETAFKKDIETLTMIKSGIVKSFDESINYIENEKNT